MNKISRAEALSQGLKRYFTGLACKRGHICERYVCDSQCHKCTYEKCLSRRLNDPAADAARALNWRNRNLDKARENNRAWTKNNPALNRARVAKRNAAKLQRTPAWADIDLIKQIYLACPEGMTVDHQIPLQGEFVSGLHVQYNLQYLTPSENSAKRNSFNDWT